MKERNFVKAMWRTRHRSRTICLSLASITVFLHLLLAFVSLSVHQQPCDPPPSPGTRPPPGLARATHSTAGVRGLAEPPTDAKQRQSSSEDAKRGTRSHVDTPSDKSLPVKGGKNTTFNKEGTNKAGSLESDLSKLTALFDHPLYSVPGPAVTLDDRLLKVKPKIKTSEKSSLMWVSASQDGYEDVNWNSSMESHPPWLRFHLAISRWQLYSHRDPNMEPLIRQLATHRIVSAVQKSGGTQLKLVISFPNYGQAMFKPMKQERDDETNYNLFYFSDFERHNAEIAAFHLDRILGFRRIPPVSGRLVNVVKEIKDITTDRKLARTFFNSPVGNVCFYGQCSYYCSTEHAVCGRPQALEASMAVMLPDLSLAPRRSWRSPWRRSYSRSKLAKWETDPDYCSSVKKLAPYDKGTRLVDFMDMVILDYLMATSAVRPQFSQVTSDRCLSLVELPLLVSQVEPGRARVDKKWTEGPRLLDSTLGTDIPIRESQSSVREELKSKTVTACKKKNTLMEKDRRFPLTGIEVVKFFDQERGLEDLEFYYLKETDRDTCRPYDLTVVDSSSAGSEHYIFSPTTVLHVTETGYGGLISLAAWRREFEMWTALQEISFFRNFRLQRAFTWWHKNVRSISFQRRCKNLQEMLLISVPQFRNALHLFAGVIEELKGTHWIPLDDCKTYTLLEFRELLMRKNQEHLQILKKLSECRTTTLNTVKNESYEKHQELQLHMKLAKNPNRNLEPIHLLLAQQQELKKELARSEGVLQKLGKLAALVHQMLVQSVVTVIQQDAFSFLQVVERMKSQQCCLFGTELCFTASNELTVDPPVHLFQDAVSQALLSAGSSAIQMCESCGFFLEISGSDFSSPMDLACDSSGVKHPEITEERSDDGRSGRLLRDRSAHQFLLPKEICLTVHGNRVQGCYSPLSKSQLEWHISINDVTEQVEKEQARIMQEAETEIQQLCESCSWLADIQSFVSQWSGASLEAMKDQPASLYEELIRKIRKWEEMINRLDSTVSTTSQLFIIHCNHTKETLGQQLKVIDEEVLEQLTEQIQLHSANFISDLEKTSEYLKTEPQDLPAFSQYSHRVRESLRMLPDTQTRLEYIRSLSDAVCMNYRKMTEQELALKEKMLGLWDCFIPVLKQADGLVCHRLPSVTNALDTKHSQSVDDIKKNVSDATSEPFLDPKQDATQMLSKLDDMCAHLQCAGTKLEQLNRNSLDIQERPLDLTVLTADVPKVVARKELWAILAAHSTWLEEWNQLPFSEVKVSQAQEKLIKWKEQAQSLTHSLPAHDAVLRETLGVLDSSHHQLAVMFKLQSSTVREKHWKAVFQGMGLTYVPEKKIIVGDLMSPRLKTNEMLIEKICREAQTEYNMKKVFQTLCQGWEGRVFQVEEFTLPAWQLCEKESGLREKEKAKEDAFSISLPIGQHSCNDARVIVIGLEEHFAEIENDLMTLSKMLTSPHSVDFRLELKHMVQSLQELEKLLDVFQRYQPMWAFMSKVFRETSFSDERLDLMQLFLQVDETFKEIMQTISSEPHLLNFVSTKTKDGFLGDSFYHVLLDSLSTMEAISNQMADLLDAICHQYPRLWFLRDRKVMELLSFHATPLVLQRFVRKCFRGVQGLEVLDKMQSNTNVETSEPSSENQRQMKVLGVFGSLQERIPFPYPLEPNPDVLLWFSAFEKQLKFTMIQLVKRCALVCEQLEPSDHNLKSGKDGKKSAPADRSQKTQTVLATLSDFPLQCVLVAEEAAWCRAVRQAFQESSPLKLSHLKALNSSKLEELGCTIRGGVTGCISQSLASKYRMMCLRALVHLTMNHSQQLFRLMEVQIPLESSFEWLSLMKYSISSEDVSQEDGARTCYIDVLDHRLPYGFEYFGPEDLKIAFTPSTDRAILGILLAVANFRCGFVSGPHMSGKKTTAVHVGKALGRQVVVARCCPNMTLSVIQHMLQGALQTGACLLLDSVNLLTQGVLAILGEHLLNIHQSFSKLRSNRNQSSTNKPQDKIGNVENLEYHMEFAGKNISTSPTYACVLISSQWHASNVPNSLRFATRPIALKCPDHRIIAEVMLTSVGFSEAVSLSYRLVSLLSLAKDSHSLPHFFTAGGNGFLGILQKIISTSKIHLYQTIQQRERLNEAYLSAEASSQNMHENLKETDKKEIEKLSKLRKSHLSVVQGVLEETAIVKAILSVLMPEQNKEMQFYTIFKETFPIVCQFLFFQHFVEETEKNQLQDAVREELQQMRFHDDPEIISSAVTLYQAMKVSRSVILVGASGSGKTTCFSALAGALNSLAAKSRGCTFENDKTIEKTGQQMSASNWSFVNSLVLFPNAMSHDELFGSFCEKRGWQDGAVAKMLREHHEHTQPETYIHEMGSHDTSIVKWLVMDGEPSGQLSWLDHLSTLCSNQDPCLSLPSGETLVPQSNFKLLIEMTDLHGASPSTVTHCSLVYFTCADLWKAVWKSEMEALSLEHNLDQGVKKMWKCLAEDLFHDTLNSPVQKTFTSAIQTDTKDCANPVCGIQEVVSFVRILRALLLHFRKEVEKPEEIPQTDEQGVHRHGAKTPGTKTQSQQRLLSRDIFLVAYIWGFGGHLHPHHWTEFDTLVRKVLFACRYKILVPENVSVFDHFLSTDMEMYHKNTLITSWIIPEYKKYTFLMNLMMEANQPVLLVGEPNSGKSTLCRNLLAFDKPHIILPASPLLSSRDIRTILQSLSHQKMCNNSVRSLEKQPNLLLFLDDLHEAPCVFGKESVALETLRQSISKSEIVVFDSYQFKLLSSEAVSYMATCCASGLKNLHSNVTFSRLSRLFSIFVLPNMDIILPFRSHLNIWLKEILPQHSGKDLSSRIVSATKSLYYAVRDQLQSPTQKPHFIFSHHDIHKVFLGMCLHQFDNSKRGFIQKRENPQTSTRPLLSVLDIAHLWMHECMRTFGDRLCSENEIQTLLSLIAMTATTHYGNELVADSDSEKYDDPPTGPAPVTLHTDPALTCQPTGQDSNSRNPSQCPKLAGQSTQSVLTKGHTVTQPSHLSQTIFSEEKSSKSHPMPVQSDEHMENVITGLVYGPKLSEVRDYGCSWSYQEQDLDALLQELCALMDRKEKDEALKFHHDHSITSRYIVHRQGATQLLHILRTLLIPGGHGVLIGSSQATGRKTTVRLAAYLTGHHLMEVHAGNESKLHEILQAAANLIRADEVKVIILVHEEISKPVREELLVAMSQRAYPALLPDNELRNLVSRAAAVNNSRRCLMTSWILEKHLHQVHRNIHIFLLMPHITTDSNEMLNYKTQPSTLQAQISKAVKLSCCVEVYHPWSHQTLVEVAAQCFKAHHHTNVGEELKASLSVAVAGIHQSACQYASVLLKCQPFSPLTYAALFAQFASLCNLLHQRRQRKSERLTTVLCRLDALNDAAEETKARLITLQKKINDTQQHEKQLLRVVDHQKELRQDAREKYKDQEKKLCDLKEQITNLQKLLQPVFVSGFTIAKCLNPSDLEEVRHYRDPPEGVVKIMDAICSLFNRPPGWDSARQLLGQPNFFQELQYFDHHSLTKEQRQQLKHVVHSPHFVPESVADISKACESLCQWLRAMHERCGLRRQQLLKQHLEAQARETQAHLYLSRQQEREATHRLEEAKLQLQLVEKDLEEQVLQLQKAESIHKDISACATQIEMHRNTWRAAAQEAESHNLSVVGDALILSAIISYLGPFRPDIRQELLSKWKKLLHSGIININPEDPRASLFKNPNMTPPSPSFGFPIAVTERLQLPLGQALGMDEWQLEDTLCARLLVKLLLWGYRGAFVQRWPLLADTQQHLEIRSKNCPLTGENAKLGEETESEMIVCADDPELLDKLGQAAQRGMRVLVTRVERAAPSPGFLAVLARPAGCFFPGSQEPPLQVPPEFSLLLSTDLPVKLLLGAIHPSILAQVHVVDLSLSSEETQELMLTQLLQSECTNLLTQRLRLLNYNQLLQEKLFTEEEALVDYILHCDAVLHEVPGFLPRVAVCQEVMETLRADVQQLKEELQDLDCLLAAPHRLMRLAASLYQALQDVSHLSPAYSFSLHDFVKTVLKAFAGQSKSLASYAARNKTLGLISQIGNLMAVRLLAQYRPRLFQSHAAVLKLLVSLTLLKHNSCCSEAERLAFLRGLEDIEDLLTEAKQRQQFSPDLPSWISPQTHSELLCLENIPAFRGLVASLAASPTQWQEYLHFPSSTVAGTVPCRSHSHLSLLQRALLWKSLLPDCLERIADDINALCPFGGRTGPEAPHVGNPEALLPYLLEHAGPVILVLPDPEGGSQRINIHPLRLISQLSGLAEVEVKSISFGELRDGKLIISLLDKAINDGHWLIFNNCHLLEQWDEKVVAKLCQLVSFSKEEKLLIHPRFILWFITQETAPQSIPAAVRLCGLTLTCDSPWDLMEELSCSLRQLLSISQPLGVTADDTELLLRCAIFHSVLLQRQAYQYRRQDRISHWSEEDLLALAESLLSVASLCQDSAKALKSMAASLVHGGHAMDAVDSQLVESVAEICFNAALPPSGSGPHLLLDIISKSSHCDLSKLLPTLDRRLRESGVSDPLLLGFGVDAAAEISRVNSHNLNTLLQVSQSPLGTGGSFTPRPTRPETEPTLSHARNRLQALQGYLAHRTGSGAVSHSPLRDFLQAEWDDLIDLVSSLLSRLQQLVQYPPTFSSLLSLTDLSHLERRAELLSAYLWHHGTSDPPGAYRIAAFRNAEGFLVAVMRQAAQQNHKYISDMILHFEVLHDNTYPASLPLNAVCLCGLELEGASWDTQIGALQDAVSSQSCSLPLLCIKAEIRSPPHDALSCKSSYVLDPCNTKAASTPSSPQLPVYHCPLYVNQGRDGGNHGPTDGSIITVVPLYTKLSPVFCSLRRVRLVSSL